MSLHKSQEFCNDMVNVIVHDKVISFNMVYLYINLVVNKNVHLLANKIEKAMEKQSYLQTVMLKPHIGAAGTPFMYTNTLFSLTSFDIVDLTSEGDGWSIGLKS